jgi:uncharacterized protein DUF4232
MRRPAALVPLAVVAFALAGCGGGGTTTTTVVETTTVVRTTTVHEVATSTTVSSTTAADACTGDSMSGTFSLVPGSAGAGQVVYRLRVRNDSPVACFVSGFPKVQLLGQGGAELPTNETPDQPGTQTAERVVLAPNAAATADVRFSPDVPGTGDQTGAQCQPKATMLRVALGGAPLDVPVSPATPVCERGTLQYRVFTAAS